MDVWSYESNMPSCGHGYCAECNPCSASSAYATLASPSSAVEATLGGGGERDRGGV